jgi:hypothetical protein
MSKTRRIVIPELEEAPPPRTFWTLEEKIVVASYYGRRETAAIANYLGKTLASTQGAAGALGINFSTTDEEREEIIRKIEAGEI